MAKSRTLTFALAFALVGVLFGVLAIRIGLRFTWLLAFAPGLFVPILRKHIECGVPEREAARASYVGAASIIVFVLVNGSRN